VVESDEKMRALDDVAGTLGMGAPGEEVSAQSAEGGFKKKKRKSSGRRDLSRLPLEERQVEIADPVFDALVAEGKAIAFLGEGGFGKSTMAACFLAAGYRVLTVGIDTIAYLQEDDSCFAETAKNQK
jgi:hypothetical protein